MVRKLVRQRELKDRTLAVTAFPSAAGPVTTLSGRIAEGLEVNLSRRAEAGGFRVLERRETAALEAEWRLGALGMVDAGSAVQIGKLLGATAVCLGSYTRMGKKAVVVVRVVDSRSGEVLAAASETAGLSKEEQALDGASSVTPAAGGGSLSVTLSADRAEYSVGQRVILEATPSADCYLTLIDVGTSGNITILFPNVYSASNAVKAGQTVRVPGEAASFDFEAAGPAGTEIVRAIVSREPVVDLARVVADYREENPFGTLKQPASLLARDIRVKLKQTRREEWGDAVLHLMVR